MLEKDDDAGDGDQSADKSTSSPTGIGRSSSSLSSNATGSSSGGTDSPLLRGDEAAVRVKQEKAVKRTGKLHFKVEARALGPPAGSNRMETLGTDKRFLDSLKLLEDFLQSDADGSHVRRLVHPPFPPTFLSLVPLHGVGGAREGSAAARYAVRVPVAGGGIGNWRRRFGGGTVGSVCGVADHRGEGMGLLH